MHLSRMRFWQKRSRIVTIGAQALVIDKERRVLLVRHGYRPGWHFPGGGVQRSETLQEALARELEEETGVTLRGEPRLFGIYSHFDEFPGDHIVLYLVEAWAQTIVPSPNLEIREQRFFSVGDLPAGTTAGTRRRLEEVFAGTPQQSTW
jgi:ADP-ribose pyrophosphatase YjhB (NUDIX family)